MPEPKKDMHCYLCQHISWEAKGSQNILPCGLTFQSKQWHLQDPKNTNVYLGV